MNFSTVENIIITGEILVVGDTHISCQYQGTHRDYTNTSYMTMNYITRIVNESRSATGKPPALFLLGDLIGVKERNIRDRQFLTRVITWFYEINTLCKGHVYSVKGNHDMGTYTDFDMLVSLGLLKNPSYVDYAPETDVEVRFHLVNYGDEHRELCFDGAEKASHCVLGHNDYTIKGVTSWYDNPSQIELVTLDNFHGIDLVISGHIHTPSTEGYSVLLGDKEVTLYYPGSPARVSERYDDCTYVRFNYDPVLNQTDFEVSLFGLRSVSEEFFPEEAFDLPDKTEILSEKLVLEEIISSINTVNTLEGNIFDQIRNRTGERPEVIDLSISFLEQAFDHA